MKHHEQQLQDGRPKKNRLSPQASGSGPVWELRQSLGITRQQLADRLHCSVDAVRRAEKAGKEIPNKAVKANFSMSKTPFNYQPSSIYGSAVAALKVLLEAEDADRVRRACADATSKVNEKTFAEINGLKKTANCSISRMMLKPERDISERMALDCMPFIDHASLWLKDGKPAVFLSEVYQFDSRKSEALNSFCEANDLEWLISALPSAHFPGAAVTIIISKKNIHLRLLA